MTQYLRFTQWHTDTAGKKPQLRPGETLWGVAYGRDAFTVIRTPVALRVIEEIRAMSRTWAFDEHDEYTTIAAEDLPGEVCAALAREQLIGED